MYQDNGCSCSQKKTTDLGGFPFPGKEEMSVGNSALPGGKIGALKGPRGPPVSAGIGGGNDRDVCFDINNLMCWVVWLIVNIHSLKKNRIAGTLVSTIELQDSRECITVSLKKKKRRKEEKKK
eukprot:TRINITY_DN12025_c0_g1_i1.p1 TRINITY_DN12025_c0_g1~~TRINITY_DN12025_c0_g1_i1.p1  ORF type:complete len:123 (+),score=12.71 TRINITY_DN12025_c0_g1_i1:90-458(+)